jgi:hypothetical protein
MEALRRLPSFARDRARLHPFLERCGRDPEFERGISER